LVQLWCQIQIDEPQLTRVRLRKIAQQVSRDAREAGLRSEELIVAVKESWQSREGMTHTRDPQRLQQALADFISLCIAEFYLRRNASDLATDSADEHRASGAKPAKRNRRLLFGDRKRIQET